MIVVIVEPDPGTCTILQAAVERSGHRTCAAPAADDVRRALVGVPRPDVLLVTAAGSADAVEAAARAGVPVVLADDGRPVPSALMAAGLRDAVPAGMLVEGIGARLEMFLERHARETRQRHLESALSCAGAAVLLADADGRVTWANAAYVRVGGGAPRDPAGTGLSLILAPDRDEASRERFTQATLGRTDWTGDAVLVSGGDGVPCRASLSPLRAAGLAAQGVVAILLDLSEHRQLEMSLRESNRILERTASVDAMTSLLNRPALFRALEQEVARARRHSTSLSVLMIDLDGFGKVNKRWGHAVGDKVLCAVAEVLRKELREGDFLARYGGDEFCAVLPNADLVSGFQVADRLRDKVRAMHVGPDGVIQLGASIGIASLRADTTEETGEGLVQRADREMLQAKSNGGNQVLPAGSAPVGDRAQ